MINAAIVGLGRWGQNLVNSVQGKSDKIRFVAGVLRHPENAREYARAAGAHAARATSTKVLADPGDRRDRARDAAHRARRADPRRGRKPASRCSPRSLSRSTSSDAARRAARRRASETSRVGVGYNWRFQPALAGDPPDARRRPARASFCTSKATSAARASIAFRKEHWRQQRDEGPAGGMTGRGVHVVDAMLYLAGPGRHRARAELSHRARLRHRRHDFDAVPLQERRDGLSRHDHRDRGDVAHAGLRLERLGRSRRRRAPDDVADERVLRRSRESAHAPASRRS